jgi:hypothetical protein
MKRTPVAERTQLRRSQGAHCLPQKSQAVADAEGIGLACDASLAATTGRVSRRASGGHDDNGSAAAAEP